MRTGQLLPISPEQVETMSSLMNCNIHVSTCRSKKRDIAIGVVSIVIGRDGYDMSDPT